MKLCILSIPVLIIHFLILLSCRPLVNEEDAPELIIEPPVEADNVQVIEPAFGTIRNPDDTLVIKWLAPTIEKIDIQLYRKTEYKITITENLKNDGRYIWKIPQQFPLSHHYLIKIISHNNKNIYNFSKQFGIL